MARLRTVRLVLWSLVVVVVLGAAGSWSLRQLQGDTEHQTGDALIGGPFALVDGGGRAVTEADFDGKPFAIFFGFTYCPDVCPTSLFEMAEWIDVLGADADRMRFAFVTVDPERDTPDVMRAYVGSFSDRIVPLTGSRAQIDQVIDHYRVYARRVPLDDGDYTMDHSAFVYLMDASGRYRAHITYGEATDRAVGKLRELIETAS